MHPEALIETFGTLGIFAIVFAESGLLIGFFLPGDSLLFTAGLLASRGFSNIALLMVGCSLAAIAGDQVGYIIGKRAGPALFRRPESRFFHKKNVDRAKAYFDEHGSKTIILARFVPVVRTFTPMVAGVAGMDYRRFVTFNVVGGLLWGAGVTLAGYLLGNSIHDVDRWLLPIIILIAGVSFLPVLREVWKARKASRTAQAAGPSE
jgi:membrane-associated protein